MDLAGQVAIVTGAGQGIGRGIALALAREGASVALSDVNGTAATRVATEIGALKRDAVSLAVDVTDGDGVSAAMADVVARLGRLDVLVNNAGWTPNEPFATSTS